MGRIQDRHWSGSGQQERVVQACRRLADGCKRARPVHFPVQQAVLEFTHSLIPKNTKGDLLAAFFLLSLHISYFLNFAFMSASRSRFLLAFEISRP